MCPAAASSGGLESERGGHILFWLVLLVNSKI